MKAVFGGVAHVAETPPLPAVILASASPRRKELLAQIGLSPVCFPVGVDETPQVGEKPADLVARLARDKAVHCLQLSDQWPAWPLPAPASVVVLGADTVIDLDGMVLGKPVDRNHGVAGLQQLANREHLVHSGICVIPAQGAEPIVRCVSTRIRFGDISKEQAEAYWETGEPVDKAGGYAIQGCGAQFVAFLSGSYSNVVGLPIFETVALLRQATLSTRLT